MKKSNAYALYTPLSLTLAIETEGGSLTQTEYVEGDAWEIDPDRGLCPLVLRPRLDVVDADGIIANGDHTAELFDCHWYIGRSDEGTRITSETEGFEVGENGRLTVGLNVEAGEVVPLFFTAAYEDSRLGRYFRMSGQVELSTAVNEEVNLRLETDWANLLTINPLKDPGERTLTAQLWNGETKIGDEGASYTWEVLAEEGGTTWRAITEAEDLWCRGGVGTRALTVDLRMVDREHVRVTAALKAAPKRTATAYCLLKRDYGQWEETAPRFVRGRYIHPSTGTVEVETEVQTRRGALEEPERWFDIEHVLIGSTSGEEHVIGYGARAEIAAAEAVEIGGQRPQFGVRVSERTALRAATVDGKLATIDGKVILLQQPR
jgi:hypothetical protein